MKKSFSRFWGLLLASSIGLSLLGCSQLQENNEKATEADMSGKTLTMITWNNDSTIKALNEINSLYKAETGVSVVLKTVDSDKYDAFLQEQIKSNDADIFCYTTDSKAFAQTIVDWMPSEMLPWETVIAEGSAMDLSNLELIDNWTTGAEACRYKDGIYGISTGMTIMNGVFYNKHLFQENGWTEPQSWDEFIELCDKIKEKGISPLSAGGADKWPVQMLTNAIVDSVTEGDNEALSEGLWTGRHSYTDTLSMEIFNREYEILGYMEDDFLNVKYVDAPSRLTDGKVAMLYAGSWNAFDIEQADPEFDYGYFAIPGNTKCNFTGKYDLTFGINANSPVSDLAINWLQYFSKPEIYKIYIDYTGFVPTMVGIDTTNKFLSLIENRISDTGRTYECYSRIPLEVGPHATYDLINYSIAGGEFDTPEEFSQVAQSEWDDAIYNMFKK